MSSPASRSNTVNPRFALLFDCDGVIVETEELHRRAYNASFADFALTIGRACTHSLRAFTRWTAWRAPVRSEVHYLVDAVVSTDTL
jgi:beta-phosphoglucomutase-like phosphatase (HAD superfamily)